MPTFTKPIRVSSLDGLLSIDAEAIIDTGSTFSHIPKEIAVGLRLIPRSTRRLYLANGQAIDYPVADAFIALIDNIEDRIATSVVVGESGSPCMLGALALDALGLGVDTDGRRLIEKVGYLLTQTNWPTI